MKNISFIFLFFSSFIFAQTSQVTVYDEYGNDLGTYTVQSNYAEQNSNNLRMAMNDYTNYLEQRDEKERKTQRFEMLKARGARVGISVTQADVGGVLDGVGIETAIAMRERQIYNEQQSRIRAEEKERRDATIKKAIESDIMNAYDYAKNITLRYKKELGIKKGSGYFKLPTMLFESQGKGKYVRQEGSVQMIYDFTYPGERNIDFADRYKQYERFSNSKMQNGESWGNIYISRETVYRNTGISATIEWEDEYDRGVRAYYGTEDSNGIDYAVYIESRGNKNEVSREDVRRVFDFYKPLLEKCIANSRVTVKKLMNKTIVLDTEKIKKESNNKEIEVRKLYDSAVEKYNNGDYAGTIQDINKAITLDPNNADLYYIIGLVTADLGDKEKARAYYEKAIELDATMESAYLNLVALILEDEALIVEQMNSLGNSKADNAKYDELMDARKNVFRNCVPYLRKLISVSREIEAIKTLKNIYTVLEDVEGMREMEELLKSIN